MPRRPTNSDGDSLSSESRRKEKKKLQRLAKKKEGTESSKLSQTVLNSYSGPLPVEEKVDLLSERYKPSRKNEHRKSKISPISEESEAESGEVSSGKPRVKKRHHRKRRDYSSVDERVDDSDEDDRPHRSSRKHKGERSRHHRHSRRRDSSYSDSPSRRNSRDSPEPIRRSRHDARESVRRSRRSPERRSRQNSSGSDRRPSSPSRGSKHGRSSHRSENRPSSHYSSTYRPDYPTYGVSRRSSSSHGSSPRVSSKSLRHGKHRDRRRSRHSTSSESEVTRNAPQKSVRALLAGENNRSKPVKTPLLQFSVVHRLQKGSKYQLYLCGNVPELGGSADPHSVGKGGIPLDSTDSKDHHETDFIEIKSKEPGTEIDYIYYVLNPEYTDHEKPRIWDIENLTGSIMNKQPGRRGIRKVVVPLPRPPYGDDQRRFVKSDLKYGDQSKPVALRLASEIYGSSTELEF